MATADAFETDPEADPPHGQLGESGRRVGAERDAVIGANDVGQAELAKDAFEGGPGAGRAGTRQNSAVE
jgi:hypothetical protein